MKETGEKYTEARRAVLAERERTGGVIGSPSVGLKLEPETLTAVIGGGGLTNLALVMPWVIRCARHLSASDQEVERARHAPRL